MVQEKTGVHYPVSEVNYEQSIVAPATDILLQVHILTGERKWAGLYDPYANDQDWGLYFYLCALSE